MPVSQSSRFCPQCQQNTLHIKHRYSGSMGCLLTVVTGGLFLPFWALCDLLGVLRPARCQTCGSAEASTLSRGGSLLTKLLWLVVVVLIAACVYGMATI